MHLPMQAALGVALAGSRGDFGVGGRGRRCWLEVSVLPSCVSAVWLGAVSVAYPTHLGSLVRGWGIAAIVWGLAFAAVVLGIGHRHRAPTY
jgi:hypothetical protein